MVSAKIVFFSFTNFERARNFRARRAHLSIEKVSLTGHFNERQCWIFD